MNALGFLFLGLVLSSLAESNGNTAVPARLKIHALQRLLGDIFEKDMKHFRDYDENEDVWNNVVEWLDEEKGTGNASTDKRTSGSPSQTRRDGSQIVTILGLLANPFFQRCIASYR
jgi:hypothetical protein